MSEKVLCPYCGGLMTLNVNAYSDGTVTGAWCECLVCKAESPYIEDDAADDIKAAALSAALQRYVEPLKPLALDGVTGSCEPCVFFEFHGAVSVWACDCVISSDFRHVEVSRIGRKTPLRMPIDTYGINWRCWLRRPTDEERQSVAWEESK